LKKEYEVLKSIKAEGKSPELNIDGFPKVYSKHLVKSDELNFLATTLLGETADKYFKRSGFDNLEKTLSLGIQMVKVVKYPIID